MLCDQCVCICTLREKLELWERILAVVAQNSDMPLYVVGDFNAVRMEAERVGRGATINRRDIRGFDEFISSSRLIDLPLHGRSFTCYRPDGFCKSRLDRMLVNDWWIADWPNSSLKGLRRSISDHCPLLLDSVVRDWGPRPFRSINAWFSHPDFKNFIMDRWRNFKVEGWSGFVIKENFKKLKEEVKVWNRDVFGSLDVKIENIREEIRRLDVLDDTFGLKDSEVIERNQNSAELFLNLSCRNSLNAQKAWIRWNLEGDLNSSFFHRVINKKRKKNELVGLFLDGVWCDEVEEVKKGVFEFFKKHFQKEEIRRPSLDKDFFTRRISEADNDILVSPFSMEEISEALGECGSDKSPGPDGFNFKFFKEFWPLIKDDFFKLMSEFHTNGRLVKGLNSSFVTLIPKKEDAIELGDFRPISLINGVYKIISKILAKRLSKVLDGVISETNLRLGEVGRFMMVLWCSMKQSRRRGKKEYRGSF